MCLERRDHSKPLPSGLVYVYLLACDIGSTFDTASGFGAIHDPTNVDDVRQERQDFLGGGEYLLTVSGWRPKRWGGIECEKLERNFFFGIVAYRWDSRTSMGTRTPILPSCRSAHRVKAVGCVSRHFSPPSRFGPGCDDDFDGFGDDLVVLTTDQMPKARTRTLGTSSQQRLVRSLAGIVVRTKAPSPSDLASPSMGIGLADGRPGVQG